MSGLFKTNLKDCQDIEVSLLLNDFKWAEPFNHNIFGDLGALTTIVDTIYTYTVVKIKNRKIILKNNTTQGKAVFKKQK